MDAPSTPDTAAAARRKRFAAASAAGLALGVTALVPVPGPAAAASACPTGTTLVTAGVCEVRFTATPTSAWTPPSGASMLQALLVGAGGAGIGAEYAGDGGEVVLAELDDTGDVQVQVGLPGGSGGSIDVNDSVVTQGGIAQRALAGAVGEDWQWGGDGAGGPHVGDDGGPGVLVSALTTASGADSLFADDDSCFGGGGASGDWFSIASSVSDNLGQSTCGGGRGTATQSAGVWALASIEPATNSGGGGAAVRLFDDSPEPDVDLRVNQNGAAGLVVIRFAYEAVAGEPDVLANTGTPSEGVARAGLLALIASLVGLILIAARRRWSVVAE